MCLKVPHIHINPTEYCLTFESRFTGDRSPKGYVALEEEESDASREAKKPKPSLCVVCLGTLQHCYMAARLDLVVEEMARILVLKKKARRLARGLILRTNQLPIGGMASV